MDVDLTQDPLGTDPDGVNRSTCATCWPSPHEVQEVIDAREDVGVAAREHLGGHARVDDLLHLVRAGPHVAQVDRLTVGGRTQRVLGQVDVHPTGEGVGDHQRRRGQVVELHVRLDPASKLRLPDSTETTARSEAFTALDTSSGSGPELPMQVTQP